MAASHQLAFALIAGTLACAPRAHTVDEPHSTSEAHPAVFVDAPGPPPDDGTVELCEALDTAWQDKWIPALYGDDPDKQDYWWQHKQEQLRTLEQRCLSLEDIGKIHCALGAIDAAIAPDAIEERRAAYGLEAKQLLDTCEW